MSNVQDACVAYDREEASVMHLHLFPSHRAFRFYPSGFPSDRGEQKKYDSKHCQPKIGLKLSYRRIFLLAFVLLLVVASLWFSSYSPQSSSSHNAERPLTAAIVDPLAQQIPNSVFSDSAANFLRQGGYKVDYYGRGEATVDFFRNLPSLGYGLIILRAHSGESFMITSEPYSQGKYVWEQLTSQLVQTLADGSKKLYFAITPDYIRQSMKGQFANSIIILMGCEALSKSYFA